MTTSEDDDTFNAWLQSKTIQSLLRGLWEAEKRARSANDPATRETARTALGGATGAFLKGTGVTEQLRQQMLEHVLGELDGGAAYAGKTFEELTRPEMCRTKGGLAILRALAERGVLTMFTLLGAHFSAATVGSLRGIRKGYRELFTSSPKPGVNLNGGLAHALQEETVAQLGYTVGSGDGILKKALLKRAVAYCDEHGAIYGLPRTRCTTVREWTQRAHAEVYQKARKDGADARAKGAIDHTRRL